jgi:hypothetical protein
MILSPEFTFFSETIPTESHQFKCGNSGEEDNGKINKREQFVEDGDK